MTHDQFRHIRYFTASEVTRTGARLADVQYDTIYRLDRFRRSCGPKARIRIIRLTTGKAKAQEHPAGKAVDFEFIATQPRITTVLRLALLHGFGGVGMYFNGKKRSYHLDTGKLRFWIGRKPIPGRGSWAYGKLLRDPKKVVELI